nr:tripartite tricarboxylate transporter substrate-binding protein [Cupriavidus sp. GA3-3]
MLAPGSLRRWPGLPQIPTLAESGFPGYRSETIQALFAPAGAPEPPPVRPSHPAEQRSAATVARSRLRGRGCASPQNSLRGSRKMSRAGPKSRTRHVSRATETGRQCPSPRQATSTLSIIRSRPS